MNRLIKSTLIVLIALVSIIASSQINKAHRFMHRNSGSHHKRKIDVASRGFGSMSSIYAADPNINVNVDDYKCDFSNRTLAQTVRFIRSPHNCRVFHVCAYWKQFSLTCIDGLYFDENLNTCSYEYLVDCPIDNKLIAATKEISNNDTQTSQSVSQSISSAIPTSLSQSSSSQSSQSTLGSSEPSAPPSLPASAVPANETVSTPNERSIASASPTTSETSSPSTASQTTTTTTSSTSTTTSTSTTSTTSTSTTASSSTKAAEVFAGTDVDAATTVEVSTPKYSPITYLLFSYEKNSKETPQPQGLNYGNNLPSVGQVVNNFNPFDASSSGQQSYSSSRYSSQDASISSASSMFDANPKSTFDPLPSSLSSLTFEQTEAIKPKSTLSSSVPFSSFSIINTYSQSSDSSSSQASSYSSSASSQSSSQAAISSSSFGDKQATVQPVVASSAIYDSNDNLNNVTSSFWEKFFDTTSDPKINLNTDKLEQYSNGSRPWWLGPTECVPGFEHRISHKENCGKYYDCQLNGEKIERACPYPAQYDELYSECRPYHLVDCGKRAQAKDLCDYKLSNTLFQTIPCSLYPSCKNLSDGLYPDELRDCRHYYQCKDERTLRTFSCPTNSTYGVNLKFNFMTRRCDLVEYVSFNCGGYTIPVDIYTNEMKCPSHNQINSGEQTLAYDMKEIFFSHPKDCDVYMRCDRNANMTRHECPKGTHFSPYYQSCVHPSIANCKKYLIMDDSPIQPSRFQQMNHQSYHSHDNINNSYNSNEIFNEYIQSGSMSLSSGYDNAYSQGKK